MWTSWCRCRPLSHCFSEIQLAFTFLVLSYPGSPGQRAVKRVLLLSFCCCCFVVVLLWSPYGIGQTIIFLPCGFFLLLSFFFPRLISAADWMSTILPHVVWPYCKFGMQVWNVLQAAEWKYRTQKWCKKSPSEHHRRAISSGYIFATKTCIDNWKRNLLSSSISSRCPYNMVNLRPTNGWDRLAGLGHPIIFQWISLLGSVTARQSSSGRQPNFAALNRGRHLCSTGRPSRWALAHILVIHQLPLHSVTLVICFVSECVLLQMRFSNVKHVQQKECRDDDIALVVELSWQLDAGSLLSMMTYKQKGWKPSPQEPGGAWRKVEACGWFLDPIAVLRT